MEHNSGRIHRERQRIDGSVFMVSASINVAAMRESLR